MSPFAIYSKTGKGVQEASGKTSLLDRAERALLAVIDGRASVADLQERFGKIPESQFVGAVEKLEAEGFIRQVAAGKPKEPSPARSGSEGTAALDQSTDLDFTSLGAASVSRPAPQVDLAAKARAEAERRRREETAAGQARIEAEAKARAQAEARARAEAEARTRAQAEAKAKVEAEARARLQAEAKARAERDAALKLAAEAKARAEAEARAKAAREGAVRAALEAKARAEAELTAKLEAERRAREELERKLKEQAERLASASREARTETEGRVLSEVEELRQRLEEKRRAREDAEKSVAGVGAQADDTVQRIRREADDLRERLEEERQGRRVAERQVREDADRRTQEEADRRERNEAEQRVREVADRHAQGEAERREAEEKAKREAEERDWKEQAERLRHEQERAQREAEEESRRKDEERRAQEDEEKKKKFLETQTLFADLSAFSEKEVVARPDPVPKPVAPVPEKKPAAAHAAPVARQETPAAKSVVDDEKIRNELKELARNKAREERRARRRSEHRSDRSKERKDAPAAAVEAKPRAPAIDWNKVADRSKRAARKTGEALALVARQGARVAKRSFQLTKRAYAAVQAYRRARAERAEQVAKREAKARADAWASTAARGVPVPPVSSERSRRPAKWGARAATGLVVLIVVAAGAVHVIPLETEPYEKALSEATGRPVRIGAAHGWLITGPQIRFERVKIGDGISVGEVHASPDFLALLSGELSWGRVELERALIPEEHLGSLLFGAAKGGTLRGVRIVARGTTLEGPVKLPALDAEVVLGADGSIGTVSLRGPDGLNAKLARKGGRLAIEASADKFAVPFVPGLELGQFTMTGTATSREVTVSAWDGVAFGGVLAGSANVRWADGWSVEGTLKARAMEAGAFAPALVSDGRTEGQGTYSMRARDPSGLAATARMHGRFAIAKGTLAKIDLSRAVQTGGVQAAGQTPFLEMTGEGTYDRGAVLIRNARMVTGGALNAEASLDVTPSGSLSGSVVAELSGRAQALRTLVKLSGTLQKPQIGNP